MFINPKEAIEKGWLKYPEWMTEEHREKCIQPNAIDVTLDKLFKPMSFHLTYIGEDRRIARPVVEMQPENGVYNLTPGVYDILSDFFISVPEGVCAYFVTRSTVNRAGAFIQSGLYDQGFSNNCGFMLYNILGNIQIQQHTRIAQLILAESESAGKMYNSIYNGNVGQHWSTISQGEK